MSARRVPLADQAITVLGAGRAGSALAAGLRIAGARHTRLWSRSARKGRSRAAQARVPFVAKLEDAIAHRGLLLLAVSDQALIEVVARLAALWPEAGPRWVLHTAGALSSESLAPLADRGAHTGVFHPVVSLQGAASATALSGGIATLSGHPAALRKARQLASFLGLEAITVHDDQRPLIHAAAVMAAGDLSALFGTAEALLAHAGLRTLPARALLGHLGQSALAACRTRGAGQAVTGPSARGDVVTLEAHLAAIEAQGQPLAAAGELHRLLARLAAEQAHQAGRLGQRELERIQHLLS